MGQDKAPGVTWEEEREIHNRLALRRKADESAERAAAYAAVQAALANYRWWGWTNIVNTVRIWIQSWRKHA